MAPPPDPRLEDLRSEVDRIDAAIVDLLAERMRVVGEIARAKNAAAPGPAIRPAREAAILRRLVARAAGRFPAGPLVRMWRELLAASTRAQAPLAVVVHAPPDQPGLWDLARDHFGSLTPIERAGSAAAALERALADPGRLAVLPVPGERHAWWTALLAPEARPLRVAARLPFAPSPTGEGAALVVAPLELEPSGEDATLFAFEVAAPFARGDLLESLAAAGLRPSWLASAPGGPDRALHLVEVDGCLGPDEPRLADATAASVLRAAWLGGYARPLAGAA